MISSELVRRQIVCLDDACAERFALAMEETGQPTDVGQQRHRGIAIEPSRDTALYILEAIKCEAFHAPIHVVLPGR